jgi:hypothetical protein
VLRGNRWFISIAVGAVVLALVVAGAYLLSQPRQTTDIAVPPLDATPEQVVTAYVDALNAHDCETAESLMANGAEDDAAVWCKNLGSLTDLDITDVTEAPKASRHSSGVSVTFNVKWRLFHNDGSMDEGATAWDYYLVRGSASSPWRISNQGAG